MKFRESPQAFGAKIVCFSDFNIADKLYFTSGPELSELTVGVTITPDFSELTKGPIYVNSLYIFHTRWCMRIGKNGVQTYTLCLSLA